MRTAETIAIALPAGVVGALVVAVARPLSRWLRSLGKRSDLRQADKHSHRTISRCRARLEQFDRGLLFKTIFSEQLGDLARDIESATARQTLEVSPRARTTRPLLASMDGAEDDHCRFVHHLDNNNFFFTDMHSKDFFRDIDDAVKAGKIRTVRRLFVSYDEAAEQQDLATIRLVSFHENAEDFCWCVIREEDYRDLIADEGIADGRLDFGLYGSRYVYVSSQRPHEGGSFGSFIGAEADIARYDTFFERAWHVGRRPGHFARHLDATHDTDGVFSDDGGRAADDSEGRAA